MVTSLPPTVQLHSVPPVDESSIAEYFLEKLRPLAYRFSCSNPAHEIEDYVSIGLERVIVVARKTGNTDYGYLYGVARNAMMQASYSTSRKRVPSISLDEYLYDGETDVAHYIEEDIITPTRTTDVSLQQKIRLLLSVLPLKQKMVVLAYYGLEDENGGLWTREAVCEWFGMTNVQFSNVRCHAVQRLACIPM